MNDRLAGRKFWLIFGATMLLAVVLRVLAFSPYETISHDEILQYQERAYRMVFGYGIVPWEARYGIRNAVIPDLLAAAMSGATLFSTSPDAAVTAGRIVFALICLAALPAAFAVGSVRSRTHGLVAMFVAAVWCESVLFGVHVLSESIAVPFACGGAAALLRAREDRRAALLAGFLLAMTVLLRLQYVVFVATLVLLTAGRDWKLYPRLLLGALPALAIGTATDIAAGTMPFAWAVKNVTMNIGQGRAANFGTQSPFYYVASIALRLWPWPLPIVIAAIFAGKRYHPLLLAAVANVAVHSLIAHKEYRFVWLSVFTIVVLAAIASVDLLDKYRERRGASPDSRRAAIAALCLAWAAMSLTSYFATGGFSLIRTGGKTAEATIRAAKIPGTCAIGVAIDLRKPVGYVFLHRKVDLYLLADAFDKGREPLSPALTDAIDTLVVTDKAHPPPAYRQLSCQQDVLYRVCLYRREGGCRTSPEASRNSYDAVLRLNDM